MRRTPARILAHHRQRREHRRQRDTLRRLYYACVAAVERGYIEVLTAVDAKIAAGRKR